MKGNSKLANIPVIACTAVDDQKVIQEGAQTWA
jgi:hypothetical protein